MATIESVGIVRPEDFSAELRKMDNATLIAQQCVQQGAIHAVSHLLLHGCTEQQAIEMLGALRTNAALMREELRRRGTDIFPEDQTGFH